MESVEDTKAEVVAVVIGLIIVALYNVKSSVRLCLHLMVIFTLTLRNLRSDPLAG
jgi:hypothetical protein